MRYLGGSIIFHHVQAIPEPYNFSWDTWGVSIIFHHMQAIPELYNFRWDSQGSIAFHHVQAKSELYNFRWDTSQSYWGSQSSFTICRLYLNFKILGEVLVSHTRGSIIFHHVQAKSELYNFRWDTSQSYWGSQSSFTICRLILNFTILDEIPGGSIIFHHV